MSVELNKFQEELRAMGDGKAGTFQIGSFGIPGVVPSYNGVPLTQVVVDDTTPDTETETDLPAGSPGLLHHILEGIAIYAGSGGGALTAAVIKAPNTLTRNLITPTGDYPHLPLQAWEGQTEDYIYGLDYLGTTKLWGVDILGGATFTGLTVDTLSGVLKATAGVVSGGATTSDLPEGSNLYYTDARARAALSGTSPITYNSSTGAIGLNEGAITHNNLGGLTTGDPHTQYLLKAGGTMTGYIVTHADPVSDLQVANKRYVDAAAAGTKLKDPVDFATTGNITLSGEQTIDGYATSASRGLVKNQSTASQNGIYTTSSGSWTRTADLDADAEAPGALTFVINGTVNAGTQWQITTPAPITLGTTAITWTLYYQPQVLTAGAGLTKTGNTLDVVGTSNRITVNADSIDISSSYVGQATITTLGTIGTGTWQATAVGAIYGGTAQSSWTLGDLLYASASNTLSKLAGNTTTTRKFLRQTGTGSVSAAPAWDTLVAGDLPGSFAGFANPTGTIGLTAVNGSAATAMRSDGAPALSQAIAPTWTALHTWNSGTTAGNLILLDMAQPGSAGTRDSHWLQLRGTSFDTGGHNADWRFFVDVTSNAAASTWRLQTRIDAASFADAFTVTDGGAGVFAGSISASNLSGTNTGDQTITLSGDVSGIGTAGITTAIGANKVTLGMMAQVSTDVFLGRDTAGTGNVEAMSVAAAKAMLGLTGTNSGDQTITLTGDVTGSGTGSFAATIANNAVTLAKMADMATASFLGRNTALTGDPEVLPVSTAKTMLGLTGTNSGDQTITLTGDVTGSGTGSFAATIANNAVTYAKFQQASAGFTILAKATTAAGNYAELAAAADGVLRRSGSGDLAFGSLVTNNYGAASVTYAKIQDVTGLSVIGRSANTSGVSAAITGTDGQVLRVSGTTLGFGTISASAVERANLLGTTNQVNLSASGTGVLVGSTSITLSLPQNIHTGAAPTFTGLTSLSSIAITGGTGVSGSATDRGYLYLGSSAGFQLQMDPNDIQAMNNITPSTLYLNGSGGAVVLNATGGSFTILGEDATALGRLDVRATSSTGVMASFGTTTGVGATFPGYIYFSALNTVNFGYNINGNDEGWINFRGYQNGTTQFRDLQIGNGKGTSLMFVDGSASSVAVTGSGGFTVSGSGGLTVSATAGLTVSTGAFLSGGSAITGANTNRGSLVVGTSALKQIQFDSDEIQAMNNNSPSTLYLNYTVGSVVLNGGGNASVIIGEDAAILGALDVRNNSTTGVIASFGTRSSVAATSPGFIYFSESNTINSGYNINANQELWLNYNGYLNSTTQFRDLKIGNGKQTSILMVDGSAGCVGIGNTSPTSPLHVTGPVAWSVNVAASSINTGTTAHSTYIGETGGPSGLTFTLPSIASCPGRIMHLSRGNTGGFVTIARAGTDTIRWAAATGITSIVLPFTSAAGFAIEGVTLQNDGTFWRVINCLLPQ